MERTKGMKTLISVEEAFMFGLSIWLNYELPVAGWYFWAFFLAPDLGFVGYAVNPRIGAWTYNILHHKGIAVLIYIVGLYVASPACQLAGLILFGHSSFDRLLGYGLKYPDSFHHTHLGPIGRRTRS